MQGTIRSGKGAVHGEGGGKRYYVTYTILFLLAACAVFSWYFLAGRTMIWEMDGWKQHYKALIYYARYLRSIVQGIFFQHQLTIPAWDFSIGEGSDILTAFHYYVIGDPFAVFSVFVPTRFMYLYYEAMVLLRMYLAGIAFSSLCFRTGLKDRHGVLAGAMAYVFCFWALRNAARHPYFLNPMVYFPLLILGVEKILEKKRPYLFVFAVFLSAVSNFYFFYMLVLATVIYVGARLVTGYRKDMKEGACMLLRVGASSVLGVLMAAVILLPMCYAFLSDTRVSSGRGIHILYPFSYYGRLPGLFVSSGAEYWLCLGFAVPVLIAVFWFLFRSKGRGLLKGLFFICLVIIAFPVLGQAFNGFSYVANRWCWAFALLMAYVLAAMWPRLMGLCRKDARFLYRCLTVYLLACVALRPSWSGNTFSSIGLGYLFVMVLFPVWKGKAFLGQQKKQRLAMVLVLASIFINSFWQNAPIGKNYVADCMELEEVKHGLMKNETAAIQEAASAEEAEGFFRFSGNRPVQNANVVSGLSSTQYYWSISNHYAGSLRKALELREADTYNYRGYDGRAALLSLAAVRYYAIPNDSTGTAPYGFSRVQLEGDGKAQQSGEGYAVYRNNHSLPLAYCFDGYIPVETWEALPAVEKQAALLQGAVLEGKGLSEEDAGLPLADLHFTDQEVTPSITCEGEGISQQDHAFVVTKPHAKAHLEFQGLEGCETYLSVQGLSYREGQIGEENPGSKKANKAQSRQEAEKQDEFSWNSKEGIKLLLTSSVGEEKTLTYYTEESSHYSGRHDFAVNLGYSKEAATDAEISFEKPGTYSFDSLGVICQPMEGYGEQVQGLQEDTLENMVIGTDRVTGEAALEAPKLLCLAIPYSEGWKGYVDGKEVPLFQANRMYMGIALEKGEHKVELVYDTPFLREGLMVSGFGVLALGGVIFILEYKKKKRT